MLHLSTNWRIEHVFSYIGITSKGHDATKYGIANKIWSHARDCTIGAWEKKKV